MIAFVSGIDTDVGKTVAVGMMARFLRKHGSVMTQKLVQTGCVGFSEDLRFHQFLAGCPEWSEDSTASNDGLDDGLAMSLTAPVILPYPASPHLAATLARTTIDLSRLETATTQLAKRADFLLVEGAGGLMVPLTQEVLTIDYVARQKYPLILVTSGRLGSISQTLLALDAAVRRQIPIAGVVFNEYPSTDRIIADDAKQTIRNYLMRWTGHAALVCLPEIPGLTVWQNRVRHGERLTNACDATLLDVDFSPLFWE